MGHNTRENTKILLKGAWVGGTMTVPGVSGGTMAMVLGIYDRLISPGPGRPPACSFPEASACFYPPGGRFLPAFSSWELSAEGFP